MVLSCREAPDPRTRPDRRDGRCGDESVEFRRTAAHGLACARIRSGARAAPALPHPVRWLLRSGARRLRLQPRVPRPLVTPLTRGARGAARALSRTPRLRPRDPPGDRQGTGGVSFDPGRHSHDHCGDALVARTRRPSSPHRGYAEAHPGAPRRSGTCSSCSPNPQAGATPPQPTASGCRSTRSMSVTLWLVRSFATSPITCGLSFALILARNSPSHLGGSTTTICAFG